MRKNRAKELALNTLIIGIGKFSTQIVSFLLLPLYTSILTTEEYGTYDLILTIATFVLPFITLLMEESMFRFLIDCKNNNQKKYVISQTMIYTSISSFFFIFIAVILGIFIKIPYEMLTILYIISCIFSGLRNALVRGLEKIRLYTIINFITSLVNIILNILFIAIFKFGIIGLLGAGIIANIITTIIVFATLKIHKYVSIRNFDKKLMKRMVNYSIPLVPNSLAWVIVNLSDRIAISFFLGTSSNGIYAMAYKFPNLMNTIYGFFYTAWVESSAKAINESEDNIFFNKIYRLLAKGMFAVSLCIIVCMPIIFNLFFKSDYMEAYYYVPILVLAMYYSNMSGYYGGIFTGHKDTKVMGITTVIGALMNLLIDLAFIKFIGIYAAAISTLISCMFIYYYRKIKVKKYICIENVNFKNELIVLMITLMLYYFNNNIYVKIINFIFVGFFCGIANKDIIDKINEKLKIKSHNIK